MSTAAAAEVQAPAAAPKKGGALKLIVALLLTAGLVGGGAFFYFSKKAAKPVAVAGEAAAAGEHGEPASDAHGDGKTDAQGASPNDFFPLSPQFVVNLNDEEAMRFLQVEVQIIAKKAAAMEAVKLNDPVVRNRLMLLFSSQTYHALLTREGKEKLQVDALAEINKVLDEQKKPHINGVVFTNMVMQ